MDKQEKKAVTEEGKRWHIDLEWYDNNSRSFTAMAQERMCPRCRKQPVSKKEIPASQLIATINKCCGDSSDFINENQPVLESVFRVFLAGGNQPLTLKELGEKLSPPRGGDVFRTSPEVLARLLANDRFYGVRPAQAG